MLETTGIGEYFTLFESRIPIRIKNSIVTITIITERSSSIDECYKYKHFSNFDKNLH